MPSIPYETTIRNAISRRVEIEFSLAGQSIDVQPHILFVTQNGSAVLRGVRFGTGWIEIPVDQIKNVILTQRSFNPDPGFDPSDVRYYDIRSVV